MAKVSRSVLKGIVKECLVEILSEGLLNSAETINESKPRRKRRKQDKVEPDVFQKRKKQGIAGESAHDYPNFSRV